MKRILILDAFLVDESEDKILLDFISSIKKIGDDILLISNTKISKEIQDEVNFFFYDKRNQLFTREYNSYEHISFFTNHETFKVSNLFLNTQPHGLSVLINLFRGVKLAKSLGYDYFYKMEYDAVLRDESINKIKEMNNSCVLNKKNGVFFVDEKGKGSVEAHYFFSEVDFFLENFWNVDCEQDFVNYLENETKSLDFLTMEQFMYRNLMKTNIENLYIKEKIYEYFNDSYLNSKHTKVFYDKKLNGCFTSFYLIRDNPNNVVIYTINKKNESDFRKIIVFFTDGTQLEVHHQVLSYYSWSFIVLDNKIEKMMVYDKEDNFLFEEYFEKVFNEIEFF
jgi:hypothetical protein